VEEEKNQHRINDDLAIDASRLIKYIDAWATHVGGLIERMHMCAADSVKKT